MSQKKLDLGIGTKKEGEYPEDDYAVKYLSQMADDETIEGDVYISEIKSKEFKGKPVNEFYVIITDHDNESKLVAGLSCSAYDNNGQIKIYGERTGRVYEFIDTFNHAANGTEINSEDSYSVDFETFRENINENVEKIKVIAKPSANPRAKTPNLHVQKVVLMEE